MICQVLHSLLDTDLESNSAHILSVRKIMKNMRISVLKYHFKVVESSVSLADNRSTPYDLFLKLPLLLCVFVVPVVVEVIIFVVVVVVVVVVYCFCRCCWC